MIYFWEMVGMWFRKLTGEFSRVYSEDCFDLRKGEHHLIKSINFNWDAIKYCENFKGQIQERNLIVKNIHLISNLLFCTKLVHFY